MGLGIWLTRQLSTRRAAVLAGVLLALFPTAVRYSQEVRMYSLLAVLLLGATLAHHHDGRMIKRWPGACERHNTPR